MSEWREFRREGRGKNATLVWKLNKKVKIYNDMAINCAMQNFSDIPGGKRIKKF